MERSQRARQLRTLLRYRILFALMLSLSFGSVLAQDATPAPPNPVELSPAWWGYFDVSPDQLKSRISAFVAELKKIPPHVSSKDQKKAETLIAKIETDLNALEKIATEPKPLQPSPPKIEKSYTVDEILKHYRNLRTARINLEAHQENASNLSSKLSTLQGKLDKERQTYSNQANKSEKKEMVGLQLVVDRISVALANEQYERAKLVVDRDKKKIENLKQVINTAEGLLTGSREETLQMARQVQPANDLWSEAEEKYKRKKAEPVPSEPGDVKDVTAMRGYLFDQQVLKLHAEERLAKTELTLTQVKYHLDRLIEEPKNVDNRKLDHTITQWKADLEKTEAELKSWISETQNLNNRSNELLSIKEYPNVPNPEQYRKLIQHVRDLTQSNLLLFQKLKNESEDTAFLLHVLSLKNSAILGKGEYWANQILFFLDKILNAVEDMVTQTLFYAGNRPITALGILRFLLVLALTYWLSRYVLIWLTEIIRKRRGIRKPLLYRINRLIQYLILVVGLIIALTALGFDISNLVLLASALGIGLGFGLQSIFNNFISGLIILFQSQLKVGDYIELETGLRGEIREINVRSTVVRTNDGLDVIIPNSEMISKKLVNWTLHEPYRRIQVPFSVAYGTDKELVSKLVLDVAKKIPTTLKKIGIPEPQVFLSKFGDNALEFELVVWVDERATRRTRYTQSQYLWEIETVFRRHNIQIPFPQRDLHIKDAFGKEEFPK